MNRTAAQMAAFVGHHSCVAVINNYVPKDDVDYYTTIQGVQTEPWLPPFIAESFHKLIMQVNIHPVRVALNTINFVGLSEHLSKVQKVLKLMCEKEMQRGAENNEVMAFKFHYLSYIVGEFVKISTKQNTTDDEKKQDYVEIFAKKVLKSNEIMDALLKDCIKQFPFIECTLFRQIVSSLAGKEPPTALSVVSSAINGQRGFIDNVSICRTCGEEKPNKKCAKCKIVQYCDRNCQKLHWHWHKKVCAQMTESNDEKQKETQIDTNELSAEIQNLMVQN